MKELIERQNELKEKMKNILDAAKAGKRGFTDEEKKQFDAYEAEIAEIEDTIKREEKLNGMQITVPAGANVLRADERKQFENALRGFANVADDITKADGQITIPTTIANEILQKVKDICPIYTMAQHYEMTGKLVLVKEAASSTLAMSYCTEGASGDTTGIAFEQNIELDEFLARVLTKISNSLINNSKFDIVGYVTDRIAQAVAEFIEKELLIGTSGKIEALRNITQKVTAASATAVTSDELIDLQETIPDAFQGNAIWIMNKATRTAIRKLKDGQGNYLLNKDATSKWGYTLFGKDVYCSDAMPTMAAGKTAIYYGDMSGLAVKISENFEIQILREKYAEEHMTGIVGFIGMDADVQNPQKIAALSMKTT